MFEREAMFNNFFIFKKLFLISAHQNNQKTLKKYINFFFKNKNFKIFSKVFLKRKDR
jgi:hypothetical protein